MPERYFTTVFLHMFKMPILQRITVLFYFQISYLTSFSAHVSQYFSIITAPSTSNNTSLVAILPQLTQNFGLSLTLTNDLSNEKVFSILLFHRCRSYQSNPTALVATVNPKFLLMFMYSYVGIRIYLHCS